jgi:Mrp family chromosome partitioning ATPase
LRFLLLPLLLLPPDDAVVEVADVWLFTAPEGAEDAEAPTSVAAAVAASSASPPEAVSAAAAAIAAALAAAAAPYEVLVP